MSILFLVVLSAGQQVFFCHIEEGPVWSTLWLCFACQAVKLSPQPFLSLCQTWAPPKMLLSHSPAAFREQSTNSEPCSCNSSRRMSFNSTSQLATSVFIRWSLYTPTWKCLFQACNCSFCTRTVCVWVHGCNLPQRRLHICFSDVCVCVCVFDSFAQCNWCHLRIGTPQSLNLERGALKFRLLHLPSYSQRQITQTEPWFVCDHRQLILLLGLV